MNKAILILIGVVCLCGNIFSQSGMLKNIDEVKKLSKETAGLFKDMKTWEVFNTLKPYWPLPKNEIDELQEKTITYLNLLSERVGKPIGVIKIKEQKISDVAFREIYFVQYENTAHKPFFMLISTTAFGM